jgi:hypothetical protein
MKTLLVRRIGLVALLLVIGIAHGQTAPPNNFHYAAKPHHWKIANDIPVSDLDAVCNVDGAIIGGAREFTRADDPQSMSTSSTTMLVKEALQATGLCKQLLQQERRSSMRIAQQFQKRNECELELPPCNGTLC